MDAPLVFWSVNVPDVPRGKRFYQTVFGWTYSAPGPTGAVTIDGHRAAFHPSGHRDPQAVSLGITDLPATLDRIREHGGTATPPLPTTYGAHSALTDPAGVRAALAYNVHGADPVRRSSGHGHLARWHLISADVSRSAAFLTEVFGWHLTDHGPDARRVDQPGPTCLLLPRSAATRGSFTFEVDDLAAAAAAIRAAGGTTAEPVRRPDGRLAHAVDDQGTPFTIWRPATR